MMSCKFSACSSCCTCALFKAAKLNNDAVTNAKLGRACEAIPMFHHTMKVMRDLIVSVEQPCQDKQKQECLEHQKKKVFSCSCAALLEPRIRGGGNQWSLSSLHCNTEINVEVTGPALSAAANFVTDRFRVPHKQEKSTQHNAQDAAGGQSFFELYDEPLYIDFVQSDQQKRKRSTIENHTSDCGSNHSDHFVGFLLESRRYAINLVVAVSILNTALVYHRLSFADNPHHNGSGIKTEEERKGTARRLYQKCIDLMTVLLYDGRPPPIMQQRANNTFMEEPSCFLGSWKLSRKLCMFVMLASMNNLLCLKDDSDHDAEKNDSVDLGVYYFQHVNAWSSHQEQRHDGSWGEEQLSNREDEMVAWSSAFRSYYSVDHDNTTTTATMRSRGSTMSIMFCQKWMAVFKENSITIQLRSAWG